MKYSCSSISVVCRQLLAYHSRPSISPIHRFGFRNLYSPAALGLDSYLHVRERVHTQFNEMGERFRKKMKEFVSAGSINMVFTEDLKHMVYLANEKEDDMELLEQMMVKFNKQNRDLRFGSFVFGPVIMRMYHHLNKPKEALKAFMNPELDGFFDQMMSFQVLMDLLLKNEMYDEVMQVMEIIKNKQLPGNRFRRNIVVLTMAAAYKKNTPDSLEYVKKLWAELQESGHLPMRRAVTFAAALAINQGEPHVALELLSSVPRQTYVTIRNLRVSALADVNRPDDTLPLLRSVMEQDAPQENKSTYCFEVIEKVRAAIKRSNKKDLQLEFDRICEQLTQLGHIVDIPLDTHLCAEIEKVTTLSQPQLNQKVLATKFTDNRDRERRFNRPQRPGLRDME